MDPLDTYQRLQALQQRRAVPTTTQRHVHLADRPLVVAAYHLAGEVGAPLAIMWGTDADCANANFVAVAEPRNRQQRFEVLDSFGTALEAYLRPSWIRSVERRVVRGEVKITEISENAPQVVVANSATAAWLFGIVGRFTRYLPVDGDDPVPGSVRRLGQNLTFFGQTSATPGSNVALAATDVLNMHFRTAQLDGETQNLATLLAWIEPPDGLDGATAARAAEDRPPAGPLPDPNWDAETLAHLIELYHAASHDRRRQQVHTQITKACRKEIEPAWSDVWHALEIMRRLPEAAHVPDRWRADRSAWAYHTARMDRDQAHFSVRPNPLQAARNLQRAEKATDDIEAQMALDDPAVMARVVARGEAVVGVVYDLQPDHRDVINGRRASRPRLCIAAPTSLPFAGGLGTQLYLAADPRVTAELIAMETTPTQQQLVFRVTAGANTTSTRSRLPAVGTTTILSPYGGSTFVPSTLPDDIPWTHTMPQPDGTHA